MRQRILFSLVLCLTLVGMAFATHGTRMVGFNTRAVGRGGTNIGIFDNTALMMTNPAGMSFLSSSTIDANFSLMIPSTHFTNTINSNIEGKTNYFPLPGLSYVHRDAESAFTWGIGAFTQGGMGSDFTLNQNLFRTQAGAFVPQEYHSKLAVMQGGPSVAYKFTDRLSVGVSAHLVFSTLEFKMPYSLSPSVMKGVVNPQTGMTFGDMFSAPPAQGGFGYSEVTAAAAMNSLTAFGFGGKIGLAYAASENLTFGLSYSSPSTLKYKSGTATMDMTAQLNDAFGRAMQGYLQQNPAATQQQAQAAVMQQFTQLGIDLSKGVVADYGLEVALTLPQSIGFGVAYQAAKTLRFAVDAEWVNWKSAFDKMSLSLSNGTNPNINRMLGNSGSFSIDFPMDWKDAMTFRVGTEYDVHPDWTLRAGYAFGSNPVPATTVFPVFPAIVENHLMLGASFKVSEPFAVHAAYELALNKKENAAASSAVAQEFNNSVSELSENILHVSVSYILK
jgi:long-chain fatty acid transport protein